MIEVEFPDGSIRQMPSTKRKLDSKEIGGQSPPTYINEPTFNKDWRFIAAIGGKWYAHERR